MNWRKMKMDVSEEFKYVFKYFVVWWGENKLLGMLHVYGKSHYIVSFMQSIKHVFQKFWSNIHCKQFEAYLKFETSHIK